MHHLIKNFLTSDVGGFVAFILLFGTSFIILAVLDPKAIDGQGPYPTLRFGLELGVIMGFFLGSRVVDIFLR